MSALDSTKVDRQTTTPFLLRLFYKSGTFHRLDDFSARLPPHLQIYTWPTCTLSELTHLLLTALPSLLPPQYAGSRIAFRLLYADSQGPQRPGATPRFVSRDLGSVVVGAAPVESSDKDVDVEMRDADADGDGEGEREGRGREDQEEAGGNVKDALKQLSGELNKTLAEARFVIGDYISAAIFPPGPDGRVADAPPPPAGPSVRGLPSRGPPRENGYAGRGGADYGFGGRGGGGRGGGRFEDRRGGGVPSGEWRRGEAPPERERERERERDGYWRGGGGGGGGGGGDRRGRGRGRW